jgi:hypothetical protein
VRRRRRRRRPEGRRVCRVPPITNDDGDEVFASWLEASNMVTRVRS